MPIRATFLLSLFLIVIFLQIIYSYVLKVIFFVYCSVSNTFETEALFQFGSAYQG